MTTKSNVAVIRALFRHTISFFPKLFPLCVMLLMLGQVLEGIGIGMFVPLLHIISETGGASRPDNSLARGMYWLMQALSLPIELKSVLLMIIGLFVVKALFSFVASSLGAYLHASYMFTVQSTLYSKALDAEYRFLVDRRAGHLSNVLVVETLRAAAGIASFVALLGQTFAILTYLVCSFLISWKVSIAAMTFAGLTFLVLRPAIASGRSHGLQRLAAQNEIQSLINESFHSMATIKGMAKEQCFQERFQQLARTREAANLRRGIVAALLSVISEPLAIIVLCGVAFVSLQYHTIEVGSFLVLLGLLFRTFNKLSYVPKVLHNLQAQMPCFESLDRWMTEAEANRERAGNTQALEQFEMAEFSNVSYAYEENLVLDGIDLSVRRGQMIALVGPSGAGKTTLAGLFLGLLRDYQGNILINGQVELRDLDPKLWRARVGYVGQDIHLFNGTIGQNIAFLGSAKPEQIRQAAERAHCMEFIENFPRGMDTDIGELGGRLSGGQKQRLALARALLRDPELLVLDEATSDLDAESEEQIQASIQALRGEITILVIAHRLSTIRQADLIYVLAAGGRICEHGTCEELLSRKGAFSKLYERQVFSA